MPDPQAPGPDPTTPPAAEPPPLAEPRRPAAGPPTTVRDVEYKGAPLDAAKGPGLGCFWTQIAALVVLVVLTPLSASWGWPEVVTAGLLLLTLVLLLFAGQTVIFLLRLVAADRRAELRRAPLASPTKTVGQLEDEGVSGDGSARPPEPGERSGGVPE
ncbi:MAG TPA: hypothetical protein VET90_02295 [Candidatus Binatus sp.]|nr:hypothetical protein [Candidatus Binatus sp.]